MIQLVVDSFRSSSSKCVSAFNIEEIVHSLISEAVANSVCFSYRRVLAKPLQLCPTLCDPIDGSLPGSATPGILE